ncbi:DUF6694 family lipoprotein [Pseudomonas paralcaligenes]|uniref:DUF6694 family lipoprotein n=1 Tax=Pseudomonas paralcaligenes TaxID=2772558 RepID=UPI003571616B
MLAALLGCGEPRLDGSSEEAMKVSAAKIVAGLDGSKKQRFQEAVQLVALSQVDMKAVLWSAELSRRIRRNDRCTGWKRLLTR